MDYDSFNNDAQPEPTKEEYAAFVEWLSESAAIELRKAKGNPDQQKQALCRYYKRGEKANLTPSELIDFLGISSPSIIDMAEYTDDEGDAIMEIYIHLTDEDLN